MFTSTPSWCVALLFLCTCTFTHSLPFNSKSVLNFGSTIKYQDCHELYKAGYTETGTYTILDYKKDPINVFCEAGGTLIQRREFGNVSFQETFAKYEAGFGNMPPARGDFWIGLNMIHFLTNTAGNNILTFVLQDWTNATVQTITFNGFLVLDRSTSYTMFVGSKISGDIVDDFNYHNGQPFATQDNPDINNCAINQRTGWWFKNCAEVLPNGKYYVGGTYSPTGGWYDGIYWEDWRGYGYSAKFFSMSLSSSGP